jgi:hypothetical protein
MRLKSSLFVLVTVLGMPVAARCGTITVDFDSLDASAGPVTGTAVTNYLSGFGISVSGISPGAVPLVIGQGPLYGFVASSAPNVLTLGAPGGNFSSWSYTLNFATPLSEFDFTRVEEFALTQSGFEGPQWTASAYDANNNLLATAGEGYQVAFGTIPAATYSLTGTDIASVTISSSTFGHQSPWLDDFVLHESSATPEPATLTLLGTGLTVFGGLGLRRWRKKAPRAGLAV